MQKHVYIAVLLSTFLCFKGFSQTYPPVIKQFADSVGTDSAVLYLSFSPNDTGIIKVQIQLQQGTGNDRFDSTYLIPASDSANAIFAMAPLNPCTTYDLLINMANDAMQGDVTDPLVTFTTLCAAGISVVNENDWHVIAFDKTIEIKNNALAPNALAEVYDITGRQVLHVNITQPAQLIGFNQTDGIYLLRITGGNQTLYTTRLAIY